MGNQRKGQIRKGNRWGKEISRILTAANHESAGSLDMGNQEKRENLWMRRRGKNQGEGRGEMMVEQVDQRRNKMGRSEKNQGEGRIGIAPVAGIRHGGRVVGKLRLPTLHLTSLSRIFSLGRL